jgi:hypothetical protein
MPVLKTWTISSILIYPQELTETSGFGYPLPLTITFGDVYIKFIMMKK